MNTGTVSLLFGIVFIAVGVICFMPNALVVYDGIFVVNAAHNLVHFFTGVVILAGVNKYKGYEGRILKIVGMTYVVVTIVGFLTSSNMMLGLVHINEADRWLHLGLAIVILGAEFLPARSKPRITANAIAK